MLYDAELAEEGLRRHPFSRDEATDEPENNVDFANAGATTESGERGGAQQLPLRSKSAHVNSWDFGGSHYEQFHAHGLSDLLVQSRMVSVSPKQFTAAPRLSAAAVAASLRPRCCRTPFSFPPFTCVLHPAAWFARWWSRFILLVRRCTAHQPVHSRCTLRSERGQYSVPPTFCC